MVTTFGSEPIWWWIKFLSKWKLFFLEKPNKQRNKIYNWTYFNAIKRTTKNKTSSFYHTLKHELIKMKCNVQNSVHHFLELLDAENSPSSLELLAASAVKSSFEFKLHELGPFFVILTFFAFFGFLLYSDFWALLFVHVAFAALAARAFSTLFSALRSTAPWPASICFDGSYIFFVVMVKLMHQHLNLIHGRIFPFFSTLRHLLFVRDELEQLCKLL